MLQLRHGIAEDFNVKKVFWLFLFATTANADVLYTWTIFGNSGQSVSYQFSLPALPTVPMAQSGNLSTSGNVSGMPNYACDVVSAEDCVWSVDLTSAPNSITDLGTNFGQAALFLCWDAGAFGCSSGINASAGALIPGLNVDQFGTYWGTMLYTGFLTEVVINDPPSVPEPKSVWQVLTGAALYAVYRALKRNLKPVNRRP
jgi:hypothetical protein